MASSPSELFPGLQPLEQTAAPPPGQQQPATTTQATSKSPSALLGIQPIEQPQQPATAQSQQPQATWTSYLTSGGTTPSPTPGELPSWEAVSGALEAGPSMLQRVLSLGFMDKATALADAGIDKAFGDSTPYWDAYHKNLDATHARESELMAKHPIASALGLVGGLATAGPIDALTGAVAPGLLATTRVAQAAPATAGNLLTRTIEMAKRGLLPVGKQTAKNVAVALPTGFVAGVGGADDRSLGGDIAAGAQGAVQNLPLAVGMPQIAALKRGGGWLMSKLGQLTGHAAEEAAPAAAAVAPPAPPPPSARPSFDPESVMWPSRPKAVPPEPAPPPPPPPPRMERVPGANVPRGLPRPGLSIADWAAKPGGLSTSGIAALGGIAPQHMGKLEWGLLQNELQKHGLLGVAFPGLTHVPEVSGLLKSLLEEAL